MGLFDIVWFSLGVIGFLVVVAALWRLVYAVWEGVSK